MNFDVIIDLITNIILLMSLSVVYSIFTNEKKYSHLISKIAMGISVSFVGIIIMRNHVLLESGLTFDSRSVLMLLTGFYFGLIPSLISGVSLITYRYYLTILYSDSSGFIPGSLTIIIPLIIGLIWRRMRIKKSTKLRKNTYLEQYLMVFMTQAIVLTMLFLFPNKVSIESIFTIAPTFILVYPVAGFLVSIFMYNMRLNYVKQQKTNKREKEYFELFNSGSFCNFLIDPITFKIFNSNRIARSLYGYSKEEFSTMTAMDISVYSDLELIHLGKKETDSSQDFFLSKHRLKNGNIIDVEVRKKYIELDNVEYIYANVLDISQRVITDQKYKDENEKLKVTLKGVNDGIVVIDGYGSIELANDKALSFIVKDHYTNKSLTSVLHIEKNGNPLEFKAIIDNLLTKNINFKTEKPYILYDSDSNKHFIDFSVTQIQYDEKSIQRGAILVITDVTEKHIEENQIHYISQHDHHTGLYNRYFFDEEINRLNTKRQLPISIILGDINGLKLINDTYGHFEGDKYIKEIASILTKATRAEDIVARWGGDEFIILLPQTSHENALTVIQRIQDLCEKSMYDIVTPSISLGLASKNTVDQDINNTIILAEERMYSHKQKEGKLLRAEILREIYNRINSLHPDLLKHSKSIRLKAHQFAQYLNLDSEDSKTLSLYAKFHDIGWITVQKDMIDRDISLLDQDLSFTRKHPEIGYRILKSIPELSHIADLVESHQEQFNGEGIPNKLTGKEIPYLSRILAILDFMDNCTLKGLSTQESIVELQRKASKDFDPTLTRKYIDMLTEEKA